MSTLLALSPTDFSPLAARLRLLKAGGVALDTFTAELEKHAAEVIESSVVPDMAALRANLRRLSSRAEKVGTADTVALKQSIATLDRMLVAGRSAALLRANAEALQAERGTLRDRIVALLSDGEPRRPRTIARDLETGSPQVSRALRALIEDGTLERAETRVGVSDQRALWYTLAT